MTAAPCCVVFSAGVPEQASELGVGSLAAHRPRHGNGEHPALCRLQQAEHHAGGASPAERREVLGLARKRFWGRFGPKMRNTFLERFLCLDLIVSIKATFSSFTEKSNSVLYVSRHV